MDACVAKEKNATR
ncbi:unnamed protein product, partial [Didymodactylos carnosus]